MQYIDTHAHYNDEIFLKNQEEILNKCREANVDAIVNVGYDLESSIDSINLSNKYDYIYSAIGIHPHDVDNFTARDIEKLYFDAVSKNLVNRLVAIGEIGLDYAFTKDNKEAQMALFIEQIKLANKLKLPIIIHSRDASEDTYNVIRQNPPEYGALFHCFQPSDDLVRLVLEKKYMVAFGGNITYKRNESFKKYILQIPLEQIVIETDSPYLSPVPLRGTVNDSSNLKIILKKLADYKGMDEEYVAKRVYKNAIEFFKL